MEWVKTANWIALFIAFLGPLLGGTVAVSWLLNVMLLLGIIVALATYNSGFNTNAVTLLLLSAIALLVLPAGVGYEPLVEYLNSVVFLGVWYVFPIALAQGWKSLVS